MPNPQSNEYIQLVLDKITIETEQNDSGLTRVLSGQSLLDLDEILIWEDVYKISFPQLGIRLKRGEHTVELAAPVKMNLKIVKMSSYDDLNFLFGKNLGNFIEKIKKIKISHDPFSPSYYSIIS
jgi:hypothetical protein